WPLLCAFYEMLNDRRRDRLPGVLFVKSIRRGRVRLETEVLALRRANEIDADERKAQRTRKRDAPLGHVSPELASAELRRRTLPRRIPVVYGIAPNLRREDAVPDDVHANVRAGYVLLELRRQQ